MALNDKHYLKADDFLRDVWRLAASVRKADWKPDFLIALWRGGTPRKLRAAPSLLARPTDVFDVLAAEKQLTFQKKEDGFLASGPLTSGDFRIRGDISSQFVSGLLFALPTLPGDSTLTLLPPVVSRPYITMTLSVLRTFGVTVREENDTFFIPGGQRFSPVETTVEGDWSNAAFLDALNFVGGDVCVTVESVERREVRQKRIVEVEPARGRGHDDERVRIRLLLRQRLLRALHVAEFAPGNVTLPVDKPTALVRAVVGTFHPHGHGTLRTPPQHVDPKTRIVVRTDRDAHRVVTRAGPESLRLGRNRPCDGQRRQQADHRMKFHLTDGFPKCRSAKSMNFAQSSA